MSVSSFDDYGLDPRFRPAARNHGLPIITPILRAVHSRVESAVLKKTFMTVKNSESDNDGKKQSGNLPDSSQQFLYDRCFPFPSDEKIATIVLPSFPQLGKVCAFRFIEWAMNNPEGVCSLPTGRTPEYFIKEVVRIRKGWGKGKNLKQRIQDKDDNEEDEDLIKLQDEIRYYLGVEPIEDGQDFPSNSSSNVNESSKLPYARKPDLSRLRFVQIDEFYPISPRQTNSFYWYVCEHYLKNFGIPKNRALLMDLSGVGKEEFEYEFGESASASLISSNQQEKATNSESDAYNTTLDKNEAFLQAVWGNSNNNNSSSSSVDLSLRNRKPLSQLERAQKKVIRALDQYCQEYERIIQDQLGGIDFFLGGLGPDGHIAFNCQGSSHYSTTRLDELNFPSLASAASELGGIDAARRGKVVTIGMKTIRSNKDCVVLISAAGEAKAGVVGRSITGGNSNYSQQQKLNQLKQYGGDHDDRKISNKSTASSSITSKKSVLSTTSAIDTSTLSNPITNTNNSNVEYPASAFYNMPNARFIITTGAAKGLEGRRVLALRSNNYELSFEDLEEILVVLSWKCKKKLEDLTETDALERWVVSREMVLKWREGREEEKKACINKLQLKGNGNTITNYISSSIRALSSVCSAPSFQVLTTYVKNSLITKIERGLNGKCYEDTRFLHTEPHHDDIMLGYLPSVIKNVIVDKRINSNYDTKSNIKDNVHHFACCTSGFNSVSNGFIAEQVRITESYINTRDFRTLANQNYFNNNDQCTDSDYSNRNRDCWKYLDGIASQSKRIQDMAKARRFIRSCLEIWPIDQNLTGPGYEMNRKLGLYPTVTVTTQSFVKEDDSVENVDNTPSTIASDSPQQKGSQFQQKQSNTIEQSQSQSNILYHHLHYHCLNPLKVYLSSRYPGQKDLPPIQTLKGCCREFEAELLWGHLGSCLPNIHHLRLGFYSSSTATGQTNKSDTTVPQNQTSADSTFGQNPTLERDVLPVLNLMNQVKPQILTVTSDPEASGPDTHYKVLMAVARAAEMYVKQGQCGTKNLKVWAYRNVWFRYQPFEINTMVPVDLPMLSSGERMFLDSFLSQKDAQFPAVCFNMGNGGLADDESEEEGLEEDSSEGTGSYTNSNSNFDSSGTVSSSIPFSTISRKVQVAQYRLLRCCLGRKWFQEHEDSRIRAARGFVFFKEMENVEELVNLCRSVKGRTE